MLSERTTKKEKNKLLYYFSVQVMFDFVSTRHKVKKWIEFELSFESLHQIIVSNIVVNAISKKEWYIIAPFFLYRVYESEHENQCKKTSIKT